MIFINAGGVKRSFLYIRRCLITINLILKLTGELDDKMKWLKNFERLLEIQRNIVWPSVTELDAKTFVPEVSQTDKRCLFKL